MPIYLFLFLLSRISSAHFPDLGRSNSQYLVAPSDTLAMAKLLLAGWYVLIEMHQQINDGH